MNALQSDADGLKAADRAENAARTTLELTRKQLDNGNGQTNAQIRQRLQLWQGDPDLAGVRAKDALARLPDEEREQWERLWSDVEELLRRVSPPGLRR